MELLNRFVQSLILQTPSASVATIKNYRADIKKFITWYETRYATSFQPEEITPELLEIYQKERNQENLSQRSLQRHLSSFRKFFSYLAEENIIDQSPFDTQNSELRTQNNDVWKLKQFKDFLYINNKSALTIKNYILDIKQFLEWAQEVTGAQNEWLISEKDIYKKISKELIEEYKTRLIEKGHLSIRSVNRKLSSLRKYLSWIVSENDIIVHNVIEKPPIPLEENSSGHYSFSPSLLDFFFFDPVTDFVIFIKENLLYKKSRVFEKDYSLRIDSLNDAVKTANIKKEVYAPLQVSTRQFTFHKKIFHHLRHNRPKWYKIYHSYGITTYFHFSILLVFLGFIIQGINKDFLLLPKSAQNLFAAPSTPKRILSFQGRLSDSKDIPINSLKQVRFALYNSDTASAAASLLWQETNPITPNKDGFFSTHLGKVTPIAQSVFSDNPNLYLGITIGDDQELKPRQQLATVGFAANAETLQGLSPITQSNAGVKNVVLALDSSGNLTIGEKASPTFQALGGQFKLSGQSVYLTSNASSNGNIILNPDGSGRIDVQKALINTSSSGSAAVEVQDTFLVNATESAKAVFTLVNNSSGGDLFTASSSGTTRFVMSNSGFFGIGSKVPQAALDVNQNAGKGASARILKTTSSTIDASSENATFVELGGSLTNTASTLVGVYVNNTISGTTTNAHQVEIIDPSGSGTLTSQSALTIASLSKATNNTYILLGTATIPSGSFGIYNTSTSNNYFAGSLGLGTSSPGVKLEVTDSQASTYVTNLINSSTGADADVLSLKVGATTAGTSNRFINFLNGAGSVIGRIEGNGSGGVSYQTSGSDFAEYFKKSAYSRQTTDYNTDTKAVDGRPALPAGRPSTVDPFGAGTLVCLANDGGVLPCDVLNTKIVGVVSNKAGFVGASEKENDPNYILVGLVGQLSVKIKASEPINPGDPLTISEIPGVAKKATTEGPIIGRAVSSQFTHSTSSGQAVHSSQPTVNEERTNREPDTVLVALQPSWYNPDIYISSTGDFLFEKSDSDFPVVATLGTLKNENYELKQKASELVTKIGAFKDIVVANLTAGFVQAETISAKTIIASSATFEKLSSDILNTNYLILNTKVVSPLVETQKLATNIISPLSTDSIVVDGRVVILSETKDLDSSSSKDKTQNNIIFEVKGSASISGQLTADSLQTTAVDSRQLTVDGEATIAGTLHAQNIVAENIQGLEASVSALNTQYLIQSTSKNVDIASYSANLAYVENLRSIFGTFEQGLTSLGPTTLASTSIQGVLSIGKPTGGMVLTDNTLNVIGADLELQPFKQGGISFLSGLIYIDTQGNLTTKNDVNIQGKLAANIISPLPDRNLNVILSDSEESSHGNFVIQNASGSAVLTVDSKGNVNASGSAEFKDIFAKTFNIVRGAQADTSLTETIATSSAGTATIIQGEVARTIITPFVKENSLIYLSPVSDTQGTTPYITRQTIEDPKTGNKGSFTIQIAKPVYKDIQLNWWIVN